MSTSFFLLSSVILISTACAQDAAITPTVAPSPTTITPGTPLAPLLNAITNSANAIVPAGSTPCMCGVFLSGQFSKGTQPHGNAALMHEHDEAFQCGPLGTKQCTNKCLDVLVKHLPNSPAIICGSIDRDCHKERAYLFIKNCNSSWVNTNLSAGREYCCKDGIPYKCPLLS